MVIEQKKEKLTQIEGENGREEIQDGRSISLVCADAAEPLHGSTPAGRGSIPLSCT